MSNNDKEQFDGQFKETASAGLDVNKLDSGEHEADEQRQLYDLLCDRLDGVIPDEVFDMLRNIQPISFAIDMLLEYGGRIRLSNPEIDLSKPYEYPDELYELNDDAGAFSFRIAPTPFIAIAEAVGARVNADEEIITSCDLKDHIPLIISENGDPKRICLIDYQNRKLQLSMELRMRIDVDMSGDATEQQAAMDEALNKLDQHLNDLKRQLANPPKAFDTPKEEQAVLTWCKKHSYEPAFVFRTSIDRYF